MGAACRCRSARRRTDAEVGVDEGDAQLALGRLRRGVCGCGHAGGAAEGRRWWCGAGRRRGCLALSGLAWRAHVPHRLAAAPRLPAPLDVLDAEPAPHRSASSATDKQRLGRFAHIHCACMPPASSQRPMPSSKACGAKACAYPAYRTDAPTQRGSSIAMAAGSRSHSPKPCRRRDPTMALQTLKRDVGSPRAVRCRALACRRHAVVSPCGRREGSARRRESAWRELRCAGGDSTSRAAPPLSLAAPLCAPVRPSTAARGCVRTR
jgi:hypothetical protein